MSVEDGVAGVRDAPYAETVRGPVPVAALGETLTHEHLLIDGIHLDYGTHARQFFAHLKRLGYDDHEVCLVLEPGGQHSERDWARRLPFAFRWLLC